MLRYRTFLSATVACSLAGARGQRDYNNNDFTIDILLSAGTRKYSFGGGGTEAVGKTGDQRGTPI